MKPYFAHRAFTVIELFKINKNNSIQDIARLSGLTFKVVSKILTDYLDNENCIVINSRMNYDLQNKHDD